jgi:hypothetical protein
MKMEFSPSIADETKFHPPPRPGVPDQCQIPPESSTAQPSLELTRKTEVSFPALGASPDVAVDQATPFQKSAAGLPVVPPTAKPALGVGALGGPKETLYRFAVMPEGIRFQDEPS